MFTAATVDFQTPLGIAETDREFVNELGVELGFDPAAEELLHISEHVIEFQVIFLQHLFQGKHSFKIVPVHVPCPTAILATTAGLPKNRRSLANFVKQLERFARGRPRRYALSPARTWTISGHDTVTTLSPTRRPSGNRWMRTPLYWISWNDSI